MFGGSQLGGGAGGLKLGTGTSGGKVQFTGMA